MTDTELYECQNCESVWDENDLKPVKDLAERVSPGEPVPYGECPECGAVCHPYEDECVSVCPITNKKRKQCGNTIQLISFETSCNVPVTRDGWEVVPREWDTWGEKFSCADHGRVPSGWIEGRMSRKEAVAWMKNRSEKRKTRKR